MEVNKWLAIGILLPILMLVIPNVYASESNDKRDSDGYSNGSDAASRATVYDVTCDPNNQFTSGGGHSPTYCNGWTNGYNAEWNNLHPTSTGSSVQPSANNFTQPSANTANNFTQPTTPNTSLVCNSAVCDNSQFNQFGFDYDVNPLNIHIHKHSGVWHNERGVFVPWSVLCNQGQTYLIQSCSDLIDSRGTLTQAGDRAVECITNGAIITIAANTFHLPLDLVKSALGALAPMTGCDGIVNLNTIQTGPQVQSLLNMLSNAVK